jgi:hypothetical protein
MIAAIGTPIDNNSTIRDRTRLCGKVSRAGPPAADPNRRARGFGQPFRQLGHIQGGPEVTGQQSSLAGKPEASCVARSASARVDTASGQRAPWVRCGPGSAALEAAQQVPVESGDVGHTSIAADEVAEALEKSTTVRMLSTVPRCTSC